MDNGDDEWWTRLREAIEAAKTAGRSYQSISAEANVGRNYVQQMIKNGKAPGADVVAKLCRALGVSITYIFTGAKMTPEAEEMLALFSRLDEDAKDNLLRLMKSLASTPPSDEAPQ
jgi:transcriptional regulator with XRE-family HTH domain